MTSPSSSKQPIDQGPYDPPPTSILELLPFPEHILHEMYKEDDLGCVFCLSEESCTHKQAQANDDMDSLLDRFENLGVSGIPSHGPDRGELESDVKKQKGSGQNLGSDEQHDHEATGPPSPTQYEEKINMIIGNTVCNSVRYWYSHTWSFMEEPLSVKPSIKGKEIIEVDWFCKACLEKRKTITVNDSLRNIWDKALEELKAKQSKELEAEGSKAGPETQKPLVQIDFKCKHPECDMPLDKEARQALRPTDRLECPKGLNTDVMYPVASQGQTIIAWLCGCSSKLGHAVINFPDHDRCRAEACKRKKQRKGNYAILAPSKDDLKTTKVSATTKVSEE